MLEKASAGVSATAPLTGYHGSFAAKFFSFQAERSSEQHMGGEAHKQVEYRSELTSGR